MSGEQCEVSTELFRYEDGELVLSDNDGNCDSKSEPEATGSTRKGRRKQTFERRNIKKVREDALNEEAKAAQQAEMERRKRLIKETVDQTKFSNIEFLLNDGIIGDYLPLKTNDESQSFKEPDVMNGQFKRMKMDLFDSQSDFPLDNDLSMASCESSVEPTSLTQVSSEKDGDDVELLEDGSESVPPECAPKSTTAVLGCASQALFGSTWKPSQLPQSGRSRDDAILLGDSDDEVQKHDEAVVIELSDGEENEMADEESEVEAEICELQDAANLTDEQGRVVVNTNRDVESEAPIYLPPHIARVIKPHQVSGIRFLYDNLIESLDRFQTTEGFGCILAHSMGLGKTIQIIGFLEAIFRHCKVQRVLAIVPINTIQNWQAEFELWLPTQPSLKSYFKPEKAEPPNGSMANTVSADGSVHSPVTEALNECHPNSSATDECKKEFPVAEKVDEESPNMDSAQLPIGLRVRPFKLFVVRDVVKTMAQRHQIIRQWYDEGGVLLLGYEMFRLLLSQKRPLSGLGRTKAEMRAAAKRKRKKLSAISVDLEKEEKLEKMCADFRAALLDPGPQLVICDEGHRIKNSEASISKALKAIKTRRRVVLTGYPLQNNLMEYWCMVDFVRPNYLGTKQEFTNMFQRPIENGQCVDSTTEDRKVMQGRAHVLHDLLSGFVQRRSHAVLKASLPPKTEVVLLIKLSPLQRTLYAAFMRSLNSSGPMGWAQVNTLKTYAMCCKIWNHPDILWRAMEEHKEAMDFDIEDPSSAGQSSCGARGGVRRNVSAPNFCGQSDSSASLTSDTTRSDGGPKPPANWSKSLSGVQNPNFSSSLKGPSSVTQPAGYPPQFLPTPTYAGSTNASAGSGYSAVPVNAHPAAGTYDWASDPELWGPDFKPGNVEHSGKILLFLSLLEACVQTGDKILVFTQSLYTLDLLERILRRLPLLGSLKTDSTCSDLSTPAGLQLPNNMDHVETLDFLSDGSIMNNEVNNNSSVNDSQNTDIPLVNPMDVSVAKEPTGQAPSNFADDCKSTTGNEDPTDVRPAESANETNVTAICDADPLIHSEVNFQTTDSVQSQEENLRSLHYRLATQTANRPTVWTKNVHYFRLDGSTTASEREKLINHFNDPRNPVKLFLVSTRAGCLGVNLIGANRVVVFDASWNPCHDCQAVCRVYRYGQVKPCYIYRLVSDNTMEKRIYDRQVTKQGMSDRVVDELNPCQQFTRSQVELLMSFEDKDMPNLTDEDMESCSDLINPDPVLASVLSQHKSWITKVPFTHESLLIDRKDYRLTRVEKRLARQRYEQEKRLSLSYQRAHLFQYQQMQLLQQHQQLLAAGINPALVDHSRFTLFGRTPNILSRAGPTYTAGMAAIDAMRQVQREPQFSMRDNREHAELARTSDCKVTRVVATTDLFFPSTSESVTTQRKIPKGEVMEIIQTPKGKYLRIVRTGDLFVVKTNTPAATESPQVPETVDLSEQSPKPTDSEPDNDVIADVNSVNAAQVPCSSKADVWKNPPASLSTNLLPGRSSPSRCNSSPVTIPAPQNQSTSPVGSGFSSSGVVPSSTPDRASARSVLANSNTQLSFQTVPSNSSSRGTVRNAPSNVDFSKPVSAAPHMRNDVRLASNGSKRDFRSPSAQPSPSSSFTGAVGSNAENTGRDTYYGNQQPSTPWVCSACGRSTLLGCNCSSARASTVGSEQTHQYSANDTGHSSTFTGNPEPSRPVAPDSAAFSATSTQFPNAVAHFQRPIFDEHQHQQRQQQEQYLRAAEEVARQSAAAYLNFNRQQSTLHTATGHLARGPDAYPSSNSASSTLPAAATATNPHRTSLTSRGNGGVAESAVHDYFAQLRANQPNALSPVFPSPQINSPPTMAHPMAAAMQQYISNNSVVAHNRDAQTTALQNLNFYAYPNFGAASQHPAVSRLSAEVQQQSRPSAFNLQQQQPQQQQAHAFQFMPTTPFDRFQAQNVLPNFRFP